MSSLTSIYTERGHSLVSEIHSGKNIFTHLSADLILNRFGQIGAAPLRRKINFSPSTFYSRGSRYLVYPTFHCVVHLDDRLVQSSFE